MTEVLSHTADGVSSGERKADYSSAHLYRAMCVALFLCASVAGLGHSGFVPARVTQSAGLPLLLFGAAVPLIALLSSKESSALKLFLYGSLLSPPLLAVLFAGLRSFQDPGPALAGVCAIAAIGQLLGLFAKVRVDPLGRAAWAAVGLIALVVALAVWRSGLWAGTAALGSDAEIQVSALAQAMLRPGGIESPWFAATPVEGPLTPAYLRALIAGIAGIAPARVNAFVQCWSLIGIGLACYLLAAPLWSEGRRCFGALLLALLGWNALRFLPVAATEIGDSLSFTRVSGGALLSMALTLGAWTAALHALRHAVHPWPLLLATCHALALLAQPLVGMAGLLVSLCTLILRPGGEGARLRVLLIMSSVGIPVLAVFRLDGAELVAALGGRAGEHLPTVNGILVAVSPLILLALVALFLPRTREEDSDALTGMPTIRTLCVVAAGLPLLLAALAPWMQAACASSSSGQMFSPLFEVDAVLSIARLGGFALAILAAGGLVGLWERGGPARIAGAVFGLALMIAAFHGTRADLLESPAPPSLHGGEILLEDGELSLLVIETSPFVPPTKQGKAVWRKNAKRGDGPELAEALEWLRSEAPRAGQPVLLVRPSSRGWLVEGTQLPVSGLLADLPLWAPRIPVAAGTRAAGDEYWPELRAARTQRIGTLFEVKKDWDAAAFEELRRSGRPAYALVDEYDRVQTHRGDPEMTQRGIDNRLVRLGARRVFDRGRVSVYYLASSAEQQLR